MAGRAGKSPLWNRALIVAGPHGVIESLRARLMGSKLHKIKVRRDAVRQVPAYWKERPCFSLHTLRAIVPSADRPSVPRLPASQRPLLSSELHTAEGDVRLEYLFSSEVPLDVLKRVCALIVNQDSRIKFVIAACGADYFSVRSILVAPDRTAAFAVPRARGLALFSREWRSWKNDPEWRSHAVQTAATRLLQQASTRWDGDLPSENMALPDEWEV
jgi:hypothetical protein